MTRIFISHSHADEAIAYKLFDFLICVFPELRDKDILCTSDPNSGLSFDSNTISDQLKRNLKGAEALVALITTDSLQSPWIPFEIGSFWTTEKLIVLILGPGLTPEKLPGPLKGWLSIRIEDEQAFEQVNAFVNQLEAKLGIRQNVNRLRRDRNLEEFLTRFKAWQSKLPKPDLSQQRQIAELTKKIAENERFWEQELEKSKRTYRDQIKEIEKASQQKNQEIDSLQLQIEEQQHQLEQVQLQSNQIEEIQVASQTEKAKLEQDIQAYKSQISNLEQELEKKRSQLAKQIKEIEKLKRQNRAIATGGGINRRNFVKWLGFGSVGLVSAVVAREIFTGTSSDKEFGTPNELSTDEQSTTPAESTSKSTNASISEEQLDSFKFETVTVDQQGKIVERSQKNAEFFKEDLGNGVILEMVAIPGGKFLMGTEDEEIERLVKKFDSERFRREKPQHEVTVQPFFIGKYQITQAQYRELMGENPSNFKGDEQRPVENVSWDDAVKFCQKLREKTGKEYRLPTEAEWEYAARAGTTTPFYFGETITSNLANYNGEKIYANEPKGKYREETSQVGSFPPNAFGLYDMHGNVWEWCKDDWHDSYHAAPKDGSAWGFGTSSKKVVRGGSWLSDPNLCRSAYRDYNTRGNRNYTFGFRVVCVAPRTT